MNGGDEVVAAPAGPPQPLEWKFSQVFGERTAGEEVQEGNSRNLVLMMGKRGGHFFEGDLSDPIDVLGLGFDSDVSIRFGSCSFTPLLFWLPGRRVMLVLARGSLRYSSPDSESLLLFSLWVILCVLCFF